MLSPSYVAASFTQPEWGNAFAADPTGVKRKLVPVRVVECDLSGLLGQVVHLDLVGLDEAEARGRLLAGVADRLKPSEAPTFPGAREAGETSPTFPGHDGAEAPTSAVTQSPGRQTWVKIDDVIAAFDEVDDAGQTITLSGNLDDETLLRLDSIRQRGLGNARVRFVSSSRVADGYLKQVRRTSRGGVTTATIELERAESVRGDAVRAGTGGMSPDDLVEVGMRRYFLHAPLPASLGLLEHMADPGLDGKALDLAFGLDDPAAGQVVRLLLVETLVGKGNAQAVTRVDVGPLQGDAREINIEWLEPHVYINVEPQRRRLEGRWQLQG